MLGEGGGLGYVRDDLRGSDRPLVDHGWVGISPQGGGGWCGGFTFHSDFHVVSLGFITVLGLEGCWDPVCKFCFTILDPIDMVNLDTDPD